MYNAYTYLHMLEHGKHLTPPEKPQFYCICFALEHYLLSHSTTQGACSTDQSQSRQAQDLSWLVWQSDEFTVIQMIVLCTEILLPYS